MNPETPPKKFSVIGKKYDWPDTEIANGSGNCTHSSKLIALSIQTLGEIIHDFAKIVEQNNNQNKQP